MAKYDLPATIKKILDVTGAESLSYVGYSQGTGIMFARLSQDKGIAAQIRLFVALAPVAYLDDVISPIRYLAPFANDLEVGEYIFDTQKDDDDDDDFDDDDFSLYIQNQSLMSISFNMLKRTRLKRKGILL